MWRLNFISGSDFEKHVKATIEKYGEKLESFDLKRFNKNLIDPIKLIFDKTVYCSSWEEIVSNEIFRQRDKSKNRNARSCGSIFSSKDFSVHKQLRGACKRSKRRLGCDLQRL